MRLLKSLFQVWMLNKLCPNLLQI